MLGISPKQLVNEPVAAVFTGQGSQHYGMMLDYLSAWPVFREYTAKADAVLFDMLCNKRLSSICCPPLDEVKKMAKENMSIPEKAWQASEKELRKTMNAQPAIVMYEVAQYMLFEALIGFTANLHPFHPSILAGHSVGEISAYVVSGSLSFGDGMKIARLRGEQMSACPPYEELPENESYMAALVMFDSGRFNELENICQNLSKKHQKVSIANINATNQIVVSGNYQAVKKAGDITVLSRIAGKAIPLDVEKPFHTEFMKDAGMNLEILIRDYDFKKPQIPVLANYDANLIISGEDARKNLLELIPNPVRWLEITQKLKQKARYIVEFGPKPHLTNMFNKDLANQEDIRQGKITCVYADDIIKELSSTF